jgi:hypothetical protein
VLTRGELELTHALTIVGAGAGATTIEQTGQARVIKAEAELTMSDLTVTGGDVVGKSGANGVGAKASGQPGEQADGGGIEAAGALTLTNVVVTGNRVLGGNGGAGGTGSGGEGGGTGGSGGVVGGAGIAGGTPQTLTDVAITDNIATGGRGGQGGEGGTSGSGGAGGLAGYGIGAGIELGDGSVLSATDTLIAGNQALGSVGGDGGGGGTTTGIPGVGGQGEPSDGGALFSNGSVALTNVTIAGNTASGSTGGAGGAARSSGPMAGAAGAYGIGGTGGGVALFNGASGSFASVTIADNTAAEGVGGAGGAGAHGGATGSTGPSFGSGGGDVYLTSAGLTIRGSIIASGDGAAGEQNCGFGGGGTLTSAGHNLDDSGECIAKAAAGDLTDTPAGLASLANNGGPTETIALLAGSAAIRAGETQCVNASGHQLTTDQRGLPRGEPCDIGAFEGQAPTVTAAPSVTGTPQAGLTVDCTGAYGGDAPQTVTTQWLRAGTPIAVATGVSYTVLASDAGDALSCQETVTNAFGSLSVTSAPVTALAAPTSLPVGVAPTSPPAPRAVVSLRLSQSKIRDKHKEIVSLTLTGVPATVKFSLRRSVGGVKVGRLCLAPSHTHRHGKSCRRLVAIGGAPKIISAKLGTAKFGWIPRHLAPGRYELVAKPSGGAAVSIAFTVKG